MFQGKQRDVKEYPGIAVDWTEAPAFRTGGSYSALWWTHFGLWHIKPKLKDGQNENWSSSSDRGWDSCRAPVWTRPLLKGQADIMHVYVKRSNMQQVSLNKSAVEVCYWVTFLSTLLFMLTPVYYAAVVHTEVTPMVWRLLVQSWAPKSTCRSVLERPLNPTWVLRLIVTLNQPVAPSVKPGQLRGL